MDTTRRAILATAGAAATAMGFSGSASAQSFEFKPNRRYPDASVEIKVDTDGNLWCGWGSNGSPSAKPEDLYSITSSARASNVGGTARPADLATLN